MVTECGLEKQFLTVMLKTGGTVRESTLIWLLRAKAGSAQIDVSLAVSVFCFFSSFGAELPLDGKKK